MRWLLRKDLLILGRSRLLVALLVVYPVAIALLIGLAISRSPSRPRVAIVDETPPGETIQVGSQRVRSASTRSSCFSQVQPIPVSSRAQAVAKVKSGEVLAAVVIPPDVAAKVSSGTSQARTGSHLQRRRARAVARAVARSTPRSRRRTWASPNRSSRAAARAIDLLLTGGNLGVLGAPQQPDRAQPDPGAAGTRDRRHAAARAPNAQQLERISSFANFAAQNLELSKNVLSTVSQPIRVHEHACCTAGARR